MFINIKINKERTNYVLLLFKKPLETQEINSCVSDCDWCWGYDLFNTPSTNHNYIKEFRKNFTKFLKIN